MAQPSNWIVNTNDGITSAHKFFSQWMKRVNVACFQIIPNWQLKSMIFTLPNNTKSSYEKKYTESLWLGIEKWPSRFVQFLSFSCSLWQKVLPNNRLAHPLSEILEPPLIMVTLRRFHWIWNISRIQTKITGQHRQI